MVCNTFGFLCEKSKRVSFISSKTKWIVSLVIRFFVILISCIAFGSVSSSGCLLKSIEINL